MSGADETDSYHSSETALRPNCLRLVALGLRLETDTPTWGITSRIVCEAVWTVVRSFVLRAVSDIVRRIVSDVTCRSPSSVVSQGIRSGAGQVAAGVMYRITRPAI